MMEMAHPPATSHPGSKRHVSRDTSSRAGQTPKSGYACPLCDFDDWTYLFISHGGPVYRCANCGLTCLHPQPTRSDVLAFYANSTGYHPFADHTHLADCTTEQEAAEAYLHVLERHGALRSRILLIAPRGHPLAGMGDSQGCEVVTSLDAQELSESTLAKGHYDTAVVVFQLERAGNPITVLEQIHAALKPDGMILLVTPALDSWSARFFRNEWPEWRQDNLYYFDRQTIQSALLRSGFAQIQVIPDQRRYSLQHLYHRACAFPRTGLTRVIRAMYHIVPGPLRSGVRFRLATSGIVVTARRRVRRTQPLLSIIVPVYNEYRTLATVMNAVVAKEVAGVDKEVIVVESNSTDGTRQIVLGYQDCPGVKVVLEDRPRGKGSAVRAGLHHAEGDFILIQDGDLEYDVNDYDALVEPLRTYQRAFVLGSRHTPGNWKMRKFSDQLIAATLFNLGHFLFATALNLMYGQRLRDPFTMYKVFRRDCLHGLTFECNRFDFDFELVIKLLRKGYVPLEIPVNYQSRSLKQGKKVSVLRDPLTWSWALIKFRFSPLYESTGEGKQDDPR